MISQFIRMDVIENKLSENDLYGSVTQPFFDDDAIKSFQISGNTKEAPISEKPWKFFKQSSNKK